MLSSGCRPSVGVETVVTSPVRSPTPREEIGPARGTPVLTVPPAGGSATEQPSGPPRVGSPATDFALEALDGETVSLASLRGRPVVLNFWASWCWPCQMEIPHMLRVYEALRDEGLEIVAINVSEDERRVAGFVDEMGIEFTVLLDPTGRVSRAYYVRGIPTSVFIDAEGIVQDVHIGTLTEDALQYYVDRLMER